MESEFYTTREVAAKLGMTPAAFRASLYRGSLDLPFDGVRLSMAKGKNTKLLWPKTKVDEFIAELG